MSDLPKLVVTREQAKTFSVGVVGLGVGAIELTDLERAAIGVTVGGLGMRMLWPSVRGEQ